MKKFIINCLYFVIPLAIYLLVILILDPFNYNNLGLVNIAQKENIAKAVEPHLYRIIDFEKNPTKNILLGDSRTNRLALQMKSKEWKSMAYGGGSLKEVIQTFWWSKNIVKLDTVVIGINLNLYNKYNKRFWVEETLELKKNFFSYAFSKYTFKSAFLNLKSVFSDETIELDKPQTSKDEFWQYQLNTTASKFYQKFEYPTNYYNELKKISSFCKKNNIKLIFWIPPTHIDFQKKILDFNLGEQNKRFVADLQSIGEVYNFDIDSEITRNKNDYGDPMHFENNIGQKVYNDIFLKTNLYHK